MPQPELEATWKQVRRELRGAVTDLAFHLWLDPLQPVAIERDVLYVKAPAHIRTLVEERYLPLLDAALGRAGGTRMTVAIVADEDGSRRTSEASAPSHGRPGLNPAYAFERFVIADGNRLAHAAALAVAEQPGQAFNPLFLHGAPGLGKTHLLQAIGNYVHRFGHGLTVRYATCDEFTTSFVRAVRGGDIGRFKHEYRHVDLLLLDDVQFLADRRRTQDELFHTFNALYEAGCQLVISSDRPPRDMTAVERRLSERFGSGLVTAVDPPDLAARLVILRKRADLDPALRVSDEALHVIAEHVTDSVRTLEGALIRVSAYASLRGDAATPELCRRVLARLYPGTSAPTRGLDEIKRATAEALDVPPRALEARGRQSAVAFARQVAMYLARELTDSSLPEIGASFGGRNHSTVLYAHRKIDGERKRNPRTADLIAALTDRLARPDRSP